MRELINEEKGKIVKKIWKISDKKYLLLVQVLMNMLLTGIAIWTSDFARRVVDNGLDEEKLPLIILLFIGITLLGAAGSYIGVIAKSKYAVSLSEKIRSMLAVKILKCRYSYFENESSGAIKNKMNYDMGNVANYLSGGFPEFAGNVVIFICSFIYLLIINPIMTLICSVCVPFAVILSKKVAAPTYNTMSLFENKMDEVAEVAQDSVVAAKIEKAYNLHDVRKKYFDVKMDEATHYFREYERLVIKAGPYKYAIKSAPTFICIIIGFYNAYMGTTTSGEFIAFIMLMRNISKPLSELPRFATEYKEAMVSADRVMGLMDMVEEEFGTYSYLACGETKVDIDQETKTDIEQAVTRERVSVFEFENVFFTYGENLKNVLNGISLKIEMGKTVAFAGPSGNGKSTLFKLMLGFHVPTAGKLKLYGKNLNEWDIEKAREQISYVSQTTYLFNGTVAENIAYGKPEATFEEITDAAKKAFAHEFIMEMPQGYQTMLSELGNNLSGGQKQRLAIARAFLKDAPIFILDEMTSALDMDSERLIQMALESYGKKKTVIIIAHRLSTIIGADEIYVLNDGSIAENGSHMELLASGGIYSMLYNNQER